MNDAVLFFGRQRDDEAFGFQFALEFGHAAQNTGSDWGDGSSDDNFELREAYLTYKLPFGDITLKGGKFVTLLGYEVLKSWDSFNHNISHAILFGCTIPFTHVGLLANVPLGDMFSLDLGVVNGWDNAEDDNSGKTLLGGLGFSPIDMLSMYAAGVYGTEQSQDGLNNGSNLGTLTFNTVLQATEQLAFVFDAVYGNQTNAYLDSNGGEDSFDWYGFGGYVVFDLNEQWGFAVRTEVYHDDIQRNFASANNTRGHITIWEITPTVAFRLNDYVMVRAEYRHDESSRDIFDKPNGGGTRDSWDTIHGEILVGF